MVRADIKIILAPFAGRTRKIDRTNAKFECSTAALIFGYCDRSVTFAVLVFGDRRNLPLNSVFRADLRRFYLLASLRTVTRWDRCTIELPGIVLPLIDAIGTSLIRLDIFLILKIGLLNIDSPPVALRKIEGDWGLFAGIPRCVTEGALCFPRAIREWGWGHETIVPPWRHRAICDCRLRSGDGGRRLWRVYQRLADRLG